MGAEAAVSLFVCMCVQRNGKGYEDDGRTSLLCGRRARRSTLLAGGA